MKLLDEDKSVSLLVLATASGGGNPGPLVSYLMGSFGRKIRIPVTLVPKRNSSIRPKCAA